MKKILTPIYAILMIFGLQACSDNDEILPDYTPPPPPTTTVVDAAVAAGNFTTLVAALQATGLDATLADPTGTFTVFAPTDDAFALLGQDTIDSLLADPDTLAAILTYHVLGTEVDAAGAIAAAGTRVTTVNGKDIAISVSGSTVYINGSTVAATDITTDNGIIHVIDAVLIPPADVGTPTANIVDTAVAAGDFTTLVAALQTTGLDAVLADESAEFTVFAPTDAAFEMVGEETINTLLANPDVLSDILLQHVVAGSVDSITAYSLNGVNA
ncbi:MAG: fasciclin domain-containing protein, partial [Gammaproteobacteria bacterium]